MFAHKLKLFCYLFFPQIIIDSTAGETSSEAGDKPSLAKIAEDPQGEAEDDRSSPNRQPRS